MLKPEAAAHLSTMTPSWLQNICSVLRPGRMSRRR